MQVLTLLAEFLIAVAFAWGFFALPQGVKLRHVIDSTAGKIIVGAVAAGILLIVWKLLLEQANLALQRRDRNLSKIAHLKMRSLFEEVRLGPRDRVTVFSVSGPDHSLVLCERYSAAHRMSARRDKQTPCFGLMREYLLGGLEQPYHIDELPEVDGGSRRDQLAAFWAEEYDDIPSGFFDEVTMESISIYAAPITDGIRPIGLVVFESERANRFSGPMMTAIRRACSRDSNMHELMAKTTLILGEPLTADGDVVVGA